jgi:hypothetical protein
MDVRKRRDSFSDSWSSATNRTQMRRYMSAPVVRIPPERSLNLHAVKPDNDMGYHSLRIHNTKTRAEMSIGRNSLPEILDLLANIKEILRHSLVFL